MGGTDEEHGEAKRRIAQEQAMNLFIQFEPIYAQVVMMQQHVQFVSPMAMNLPNARQTCKCEMLR